MLNVADKKFKKAGAININTLISDATNTGLSDGIFDVALISLVLHESSEALCTRLINEAKRIIKDDGRLFIIEWEQPKQFVQRVKFAPIKWMEPKGFKQFINLDLQKWFYEKGFKLVEKKSCDYSQVLELAKI